MKRLVLWLFVLACVAGCGGGKDQGGTADGGGASGASLSGTVAQGLPLGDIDVVVVDARGARRVARTERDGTYEVGVGGLRAPFLVTAGGMVGISFDGETICNVTPLTDVPLRLYFSLHGWNVSSLQEGQTAPILPGAGELAPLDALLRRVLTAYAAGLDLDAIDFRTTPFDADGSGVDGLLDTVREETRYNDLGQIMPYLEVDTETGRRTNLFTFTEALGEVLIVSVDYDGQGNIAGYHVLSTVVPRPGSPAAAAFEGVAALIERVRDADTSSVIDPAFLDDGARADLGLARLLSRLGGGGIVRSSVEALRDLDPATGTATADVTWTRVDGTRVRETLVVKEDERGRWRLFGNQRPVRLSFSLDRGEFDSLRDELVSRIEVHVPDWTDHDDSDPGALLIHVVVGGEAFDLAYAGRGTESYEVAGAVISQSYRAYEAVRPGARWDAFDADPQEPSSAGCDFTFTIAGVASRFRIPFGEVTAVPLGFSLSILGDPIAPGSLASLPLDFPLTASWHPASWPVASSALAAHVTSDRGGLFEVAGTVLSTASGSLTVPSTCPDGGAPARVKLVLTVRGVGGETTSGLLLWEAP